MDEIIIDEKKYISAKRAAAETGYAKDYVGQLCREGRIAARLVGRNWYVLEAAIQDHRFGKAPQEEILKKKPEESMAVVADWSPVRYEPEELIREIPVVLPTVAEAVIVEEVAVQDEIPNKILDTSAGIEEAWNSWFNTKNIRPIDPPQLDMSRVDEIELPIRSIYHPPLSVPISVSRGRIPELQAVADCAPQS